MAGALQFRSSEASSNPRCTLSVRPVQSGPQFPSFNPEISRDCDARSPEALAKVKKHQNLLAQAAALSNDGDAKTIGKMAETVLRNAMGDMERGTKQTLTLEGIAAAGALVGVKSGLEVKHENDGSFTVQMSAAASAGLGAVLLGQKVTARAGMEPKFTFRFGSAEEAADKMAAMFQAAAMMPGLLGSATRRFADDDALQRIAAAMTNMKSVRFEIFGKGGGEVGLPVEVETMKTKAEAQLSGKFTYEYDFQTRKLVQEQSLQLSQAAAMKLEGIEKLLPSMFHGAKLDTSVALRQTHDFGPDQLARLMSSGSIGDAIDAFETLHTPELVGKLTVKGAGMKVALERAVRLDQGLEATLKDLFAFNPMTELNVNAAFVTEQGFNAKLLGMAASVGYERERAIEIEPGPFDGILKALEFQASEHASAAALLAVHHALSPRP